MDINELMNLMIKLKTAGNQAGFTDEEIGKFEILKMEKGDKSRFYDVDFVIQLAQIKRKDTFVFFEELQKSKAGMIKPFKLKL